MTVIISGTDGVSDVDGTAGTPALRGTDANTGIFFGADQVGVATNGVERVEFGNSETVFNDGGADVDFRVEGDTNANLFFVDASTDRVGIGTSTPTAKLQINYNDVGNAVPAFAGSGFAIRSGVSISLASGATQTFSCGGGIFIIYMETTGQAGVFFAQDVSATIVKLAGEGEVTDTGSTWAVTKSGGAATITLKNKVGATRVFSIISFSV